MISHAVDFSLRRCRSFTVAVRGSNLPPLEDFQGTYESENGQTLEIVAGKQLFAVVDEAKYPLKRTGEDSFATVGDESVAFVCDASRK